MTRAAFRQTLDRLRTSYWFLPVLGALLAIIVVRTILWIDAQIPNESLADSRLILNAPLDQARALMINLGSAILATTGIVFTLLTVPLSLAASQFGSRLLRVFLRDGTIQGILAVFVGAFVYCFMLALAIPMDETRGDTPQLAVTFGLMLSIVALASLLLLIQHIASALQAPNLVAAASNELGDVIESFMGDGEEGQSNRQPVDTESLFARLEKEGYPIYAAGQGYIQAVDVEVALLVATRHDLLIRLVRSPGHFVQAGELIALADPYQNVHSLAATNIADAYRLGNLRTPGQDLEYAVNQIVEVAVRAMSAAINDPYTAMTCLEHLGARLSAISTRPMPPLTVYDADGRLRLITDDYSFSDLLSAAFNMLRRASRETPDVLLSMLDAMDEIGRAAYSDQYRADLSHHATLVKAESDVSSSIAWDKERVNRRYAEVSASLAGKDI
jgi:uncharacterized membrane protein